MEGAGNSLQSWGVETAEDDRLLPGEDPESSFPDDAEHFVSVYAELLRFQELAVSQAEAESSGGGEHLEHLRLERDRLRRRLDFWRRRQRELGGG
jgi:hypothetical protein